MPKATLGGYILIASRPITWTVSSGVYPNTEIFDVMPADAPKLLSNHIPIKLEIEGALSVSNLWVLGESPSESSNVRSLIVSDRRWMWPYSHVYRRFNMGKRVGLKRLKDPASIPQQLEQVEDKISFHEWSLNAGVPWTAKDVLTSIFNEVLSIDLGGSAKIENNTDFLNQLPIEDLIIDDAGDAAIERALAFLPGIKIWVNNAGNVIVDTENNPMGVAKQANYLAPEIVGGGHIVNVSNAIRRPRKISVLFSREHELRFDYYEDKTFSSDKTMVVIPDARIVQNVLPIPDYKLTVDGIDLCQYTWIRMSQAFDAWGDVTPEFGKLDYDWIMESLIPHNGLFAIVQAYAELNTKVDWTARLAMVSQHFRQTYRINPNWMAKISTIKANRIATLDPVTGNRAPAIAYCDYVSFFTQRLWSDNKRMNTPRNLEYARNYKGYPSQTGGGSAIDANSQPAPAKVSVVDPDLGIIRADFVVDMLRLSDLIMPGNMVSTSIPSSLLDRTNGKYVPVTLDSVVDGFDNESIPALEREFKIAFVLTATPAAPNDTRQLYSVDIAPGDVSTEVPGLGDCLGPPMQIRIPANVQTARFSWSDAPDDVAAIEKSFGINTTDPSSVGIDKLCINGEKGNYTASLQRIAKAAAAQMYATMIDHPVGGATGAMKSYMVPLGWIKAVIHELTTSGELVTHLAIPEKIPEISLFRYMDTGTRALILHSIVQNTK